jgi:LacI family transcriptional regulator
VPRSRKPEKPQLVGFPVTKDVAAHAGVSTATVSRVFSGSAGVKPEKREAVLKAAQDLGFVANGAARALTTRRFMAVGAIVPNLGNEAFVRTLVSFQERLRLAGYSVVAANAGYDLKDELREASFVLERGVDALLLVGDIHHPDLYELIKRKRVPFIQTFTLSDKHFCVGFDNEASGTRAANYLMSLGHQRIGLVSSARKDNDRGGARAVGVVRALRKRGLGIAPGHDVEMAYGIAGGRDALRQILSAPGNPPTALICGTDQIAFGVMAEAATRGISVPADLSVVGFNDSDFAAFLNPPLTTIRTHSTEIGQAAAESLVAQMTGEVWPRLTEIEAELIVRDSAAPPKGRA